MVRLRSLGLVGCLSLLFIGAGCAPREPAAEVHAAPEREPTSITVFGERLLLFLEYPHLVRGAPAHFLAHLSVAETGEPVRSGRVKLEIGTLRFESDAPRREGLFVPEGSPPEAGSFPARLIVASPQAEETLELGSIVVHPGEREADAAAAAAGDEPPNAVPFLMEAQWKVKLRVAEAQPRTLDRRLGVPARVVTPEGRSAVVSAPVGGRLLAPPTGALPASGTRVEAGQVLAFVEPPLGAPELAQLRALELERDRRALEVLREAQDAQTRVRFAERERERIATLRTEGLSTQQQLEQAEQSVAEARIELEAAARMKEALERWSSNHATQPGSADGGPLRFDSSSPIAGTLVEVAGVVGASVEAGDTLARVLDTSRVWIEGRVSEFDLARLGEGTGAVAELAAFPARRVELRGVNGGRPFVGQEVDASSRTLLVRYEIENQDGALRPGMLAQLHLSTGTHAAPVAVPKEAVITDQGIPTAYVMLEGELFQKRELELGIDDGAWVEVRRGIEAGEHVATHGAYVVKLAALSPASFGAGHAH